MGRKRNEIALDYLEKVGLRDWAEHMPNEMSGGQETTCRHCPCADFIPQVILADEPTGALDSKSTIDVMELLPVG